MTLDPATSTASIRVEHFSLVVPLVIVGAILIAGTKAYFNRLPEGARLATDAEREAMQRLMKSFIDRYRGRCFARVVSLGHPAIYSEVLADARIVIDPGYKGGGIAK